MPKIVDHAERRSTIARTFGAHVAEHGFAATTYARTAAAVGVSVGTVQHYFGSRDELARAAFAALLDDRDTRIVTLVTAGEQTEAPIRTLLLDALRELLPLDDVRRREHRLLARLRAEAPYDPGLGAIATQVSDDLHRRVAAAVTNGTRCGEVRADVDADVAARRVLATAHGLAIALADGERSGRDEVDAVSDEVLAPVLATVFTGPCRRHRG